MTAGRKFTIPLGPQERVTAREIAEHWSDPQNAGANAHVLELLLRALDDLDDVKQRTIEAAAQACDALVSETGLSVAGMCADRVRDLHAKGFDEKQISMRAQLAKQEQLIRGQRNEIEKLRSSGAIDRAFADRGGSIGSKVANQQRDNMSVMEEWMRRGKI